MKKATIISAFLGTLIEVYDFTIFPLLIPVLSDVFFSAQTKHSAINFTLLAYVVSYIIKPFGAIGFGYLIDYYGRKKILLLTTVLMTIATLAIGLLPASIMSLYCGVGLILCRIIQGLSISGEFSSAIIMAVEQDKKYPAFFGSLAFMGGSIGLLLANLSVFVLLNIMSHEQMIHYAWRIPFWIGAVGCFLLLLIRHRINPDIVPISSNFIDLLTEQKKRTYNNLYSFKLICICILYNIYFYTNVVIKSSKLFPSNVNHAYFSFNLLNFPAFRRFTS